MPFGQFQVRWRAFQGEPEALFQEPGGRSKAEGRSKRKRAGQKPAAFQGEPEALFQKPFGRSRWFQKPFGRSKALTRVPRPEAKMKQRDGH